MTMKNRSMFRKTFTLLFLALMSILIVSPIYSQDTSESFETISTSNLDRLESIASWKPDDQLLSKGMFITPAKNSNIMLIENRDQNMLGTLNLDKQILGLTYHFNTNYVINRTAISPDGQFAAVQDYTSFEVWATATGKTIIQGKVSGTDTEVNGLLFSPQSDKFAYVVSTYQGKSSEDGIYIFDLSTGKQTKKLEPPAIELADFSPDDNNLISTGDDGSLYLWDSKTQKFNQIRQADGKITTHLEFVSPELVVMTLADDKSIYLEYWNTQTKQELLFSKEKEVSDYRHDGISQLRLSDNVSFRLWSIFQEKDLATLNNVGVIEAIDSQNNIVTTGGISFFQLDTGKLLRTITLPNIYNSAFSYDSKYVIFSGGEGFIQLWAVKQQH
jgi:WD40 repeat protein